MIAAQAALETRMLLRNGEQLLLTVIIPSLLLVLFSTVDIVDTGAGEGRRLPRPRRPRARRDVHRLHRAGHRDRLRAALRGAQAARRLAAAPLGADDRQDAAPCWSPRCCRSSLLTVIAFALGWSPHGNPLAVLLLLVLGTAAFSGLGLLMAGTLKAEATLAAANLVFLLLLVGGGVIVPLDKFPDAARGRAGAAADLGALRRAAGRAPARRRDAVGRPGDPRGVGGRSGWRPRRASSAGSSAPPPRSWDAAPAPLVKTAQAARLRWCRAEAARATPGRAQPARLHRRPLDPAPRDGPARGARRRW